MFQVYFIIYHIASGILTFPILSHFYQMEDKTKDVILVRHLLQFAPKVLVGALGRQYARGTLRSVSMFAGGDSSCLPVSSYMYIEPEVPEYLDIFCPLAETRNEGLKCTLYKNAVYQNFDFNKFSICAVVSNFESAS